MTITEATALSEWIQKAFPHMKMEARLYIRALVHYEHQPAAVAIEDAIQNNWKRMPNVAEVVEVIKSSSLPRQKHCETCQDDRMVWVGNNDYAPCPDCSPLSGTDYLLLKSGNRAFTGIEGGRAMDPVKVRELSEGASMVPAGGEPPSQAD